MFTSNPTWVKLENQWYNAGALRKTHSGGPAVIDALAGRDATHEIRSIHRNPNFVIGELKKAQTLWDSIQSIAFGLTEKISECTRFLSAPPGLNASYCREIQKSAVKQTPRLTTAHTVSDVEFQNLEAAFRGWVLDRNRTPCIAARTAVNKGTYGFAVSADPLGSPSAAREHYEAISNAIEQQTANWDEGNFYTPQIMLFPNTDCQSEAEFEQKLWSHLSQVISLEKNENPDYSNASEENQPSLPGFKFKIRGREYFVVGFSPMSCRTSRNFQHPGILLNALQQFDHLRDTNQYGAFSERIRANDARVDPTKMPNQNIVNVDPTQYSIARQFTGIDHSGEYYWESPAERGKLWLSRHMSSNTKLELSNGKSIKQSSLFKEIYNAKDFRESTALQQYAFLLSSTNAACRAFIDGDWSQFDPVVGDNACQLRAIFFEAAKDNSQLKDDITQYMKGYQEIESTLSKLVEHANENPSKFAKELKEFGKNFNFEDFLSKHGLNMVIPRDVFFIMTCFVLNGARDGVSNRIDSRLLFSSDSVRSLGAKLDGLTPKKMTNVLNHLQRICSEDSISTFYGLCRSLPKNKDTQRLMQSQSKVLRDEFGRLCSPNYVNMTLFYRLCAHHGIPIEVKINNSDTGEQAALNIIYDQDKKDFAIDHDATALREDRKILIECATSSAITEDYLRQLQDIGIMKILMANEAAHDDYPGLNKDTRVESQERQALSDYARSIGATRDNDSAFFVDHVSIANL